MGGLQSSPQAGAAQAGFQRPFGDASARRARRKNSSVLAHGWSLAKKTAGAVLPGSLLAEAAAEAGPGRGFRPCSAQSGCSSGLGLSADSLDSNCNYIHLPGDYAPASTALRPLRAKLRLQRASSRLSRESDGLSGGRYPLETELSRKLTLREQDRRNNNSSRLSFQPSPPAQRLGRLFSRLTQRKGFEKRASLSNSSSGASSAGSARSPDEPDRSLASSCSFVSSADSLEAAPCLFGRSDLVHASTAELLLGLGRFVAEHAAVRHFDAAQLVMWLRAIDRSLMLQGWQDVAFVNPANLVFVYFLLREQLARELGALCTVAELQSLVRTCLYVSYSYLGNEISYPLKPFISADEDRKKFWDRCVQLVDLHSEDMLRLNTSTAFFLEVFAELRSYACSHLH